MQHKYGIDSYVDDVTAIYLRLCIVRCVTFLLLFVRQNNHVHICVVHVTESTQPS